MTDLIKRLIDAAEERQDFKVGDLLGEAADEIERLKARVEELEIEQQLGWDDE